MASPTPIQENLTTQNANYASTFTQGHLPLPPSQHYIILTCMDARIDPSSAFGIPLGAAHVIRNAGGMVSDALRSIVISQQLLGTTEILVIKHTGCGMLTFTEEDVEGVVEGNLGKEAVEEVKGPGGFKQFLPFKDLEAAVVKDVEVLKGSRLVRGGTVVSGWVYEVESGKVRKVC